MYNYGCRHTFTKGRATSMWTEGCVVCAQPIGLLSSLYRCTSCRCAVHSECYQAYIQLLHDAGEAMQGQGPSSATAAPPVEETPPPNSAVLDSLAAFVTRQGTSLMEHLSKTRSEAETQGKKEEASSSPNSGGTSSSSRQGFDVEGFLTLCSGLMAPQRADATAATSTAETPLSWWTKVSSPSPTSSSAQGEACSVHRLQPQRVFLPSRCGSCLSGKTLEQREAVMQSASASRSVFVADRIAKEGFPMSSMVGFGASAYVCQQCGLTLHPLCLYTMADGSYEVTTPSAHSPPTASPHISGAQSETLAIAFANFVKGFQSTENASRTLPGSGEGDGSQKSTEQTQWSAAKALLSAYLSSSTTRGDANAEHILKSIFSLLDVLYNRHPDVLGSLFNPAHMQSLSKQHQDAYQECCDSLPDAPMLLCDGPIVKSPADTNKHHPPSTAGAVFVPTMIDGVTVLKATNTTSENEKPEYETVSHHPAIQHLREALRFAIAVYGETYQKGFLSSMFGSALVFTVSKRAVGAAAVQDQDDGAVTQVLALPPSALQLSRWSTMATEPSYVLLLDHVTQRIVVAFRGTLTDVDILTDLCAFGESFCGGKAHQGAARVVNSMFDNRASQPSSRAHDAGDSTRASALAGEEPHLSAPQLSGVDRPDALLDKLEALAATHPSYHILITGHSLGGGVAVLFGVRLAYDRASFSEDMLRRVHVIAFAPMPTLTLPAAESFDEGGEHYVFPIWSIVNGCDIVSRLQINSIDRVGSFICGKHAVAKDGDEVEMQDRTPSRQHSEKMGPDGDAAESLSDELHHPGKVFMITTPWSAEENRLVEVPRAHMIMRDIFLMRPLFALHMMDNYMEGLRNVRTRKEVNTPQM